MVAGINSLKSNWKNKSACGIMLWDTKTPSLLLPLQLKPKWTVLSPSQELENGHKINWTKFCMTYQKKTPHSWTSMETYGRSLLSKFNSTIGSLWTFNLEVTMYQVSGQGSTCQIWSQALQVIKYGRVQKPFSKITTSNLSELHPR
jgi:hypothetical protein